MAKPNLLSPTDSGNVNSTGTWNPEYPAYEDGDLVVLAFASDGSSVTHGTLPTTGPNGETITAFGANTNNGGSGGPVVTGLRWIGSATTATGSLTITPSGNEQWAAMGFKVAAGDFDAADPVDDFQTSGSSTGINHVPSAAVTATAIDGLVVAWLCPDTDPITATPTGWTDQGDFDAGSVQCLLSARDAGTTASESVPVAQWTIANDNSTSFTMIIKAATGSGPTPVSVTTSGTGTSVLTKVLTATKSASTTGTGTATFSEAMTLTQIFTTSGIGTSSLVKTIGKAFTTLATGISTLVKKISKDANTTGTGTVVQDEGFVSPQASNTTGTGTVSSTQTFIEGVISIVRVLTRPITRLITRLISR